MQSYHGTDVDTATNISQGTTQVDVKRGGGEFGRGFYVASSAPIALQYAIGRFGVTRARALSIDIQEAAFANLDVIALTQQQAAQTRQQCRNQQTTKSRLLGADVVYGPIEGAPRHTQYKFESATAQNLLNNPRATTITVLL